MVLPLVCVHEIAADISWSLARRILDSRRRSASGIEDFVEFADMFDAIDQSGKYDHHEYFHVILRSLDIDRL